MFVLKQWNRSEWHGDSSGILVIGLGFLFGFSGLLARFVLLLFQLLGFYILNVRKYKTSSQDNYQQVFKDINLG